MFYYMHMNNLTSIVCIYTPTSRECQLFHAFQNSSATHLNFCSPVLVKSYLQSNLHFLTNSEVNYFFNVFGKMYFFCEISSHVFRPRLPGCLLKKLICINYLNFPDDSFVGMLWKNVRLFTSFLVYFDK